LIDRLSAAIDPADRDASAGLPVKDLSGIFL